MKKLLLLIGLVLLVSWQESKDPVAAQEPCCPEGQKSPHLGCVNGQCVQINECGVDDCWACACDPTGFLEWDCVVNRCGQWDPISCSCMVFTTCDPCGHQESDCILNGGFWDSLNCVCFVSCSPGPWVYTHTTSANYEYCDCTNPRYDDTSFRMVGDAYDCTIYWHRYERYCQDGSLYETQVREETDCRPGGRSCDCSAN